MQLSSLILALSALTLNIAAGQSTVPLNDCPNGIKVRKEYRDLTRDEWNTFRDALLSLQDNPSPDGGNYSEYDYYTKIHLDNMNFAHNVPAFFPWHRAYITALEKRLQLINPNITIPYWDSNSDSRNPLASPIFSPDLGMDVNVGPNGDCRYRRAFYTNHCLIRNYNPNNFGPFNSASSVDRMVQNSDNYEQFRGRIESGPHARVHISVGGPGGDMTSMASPNDPIFFMHHSYIDYLWWRWQNTPRRGVNPRTDYGGNSNTVMNPFGLRVNQLFETEPLCFTYQPYSGRQTFAAAALNTKYTSEDETTYSESYEASSVALVAEEELEPIPPEWIYGKVQLVDGKVVVEENPAN